MRTTAPSTADSIFNAGIGSQAGGGGRMGKVNEFYKKGCQEKKLRLDRRREDFFSRSNQQLALAFSHVIHGGLQFAGEFYGATQLNKTTPGFASSLWALTYTVVPRLVIDGGFEAGLTSGGPHRHAFVGATYSIANLYRAPRKRSSSP